MSYCYKMSILRIKRHHMAIGRVRPASVRSLKPRYLHDPWPIAASAVALVVAMPILVVVSSLAWPQWSVWRHLWQTQLPELIGNTLALIVGVGTGVALIGTALA